MNDELDSRIDEALSAWPLPERSDEQWEAFAARIDARLDEALPVLDPTEPPRFADDARPSAATGPRPGLSRGSVLALVSIAAVVLLGVGVTAMVTMSGASPDAEVAMQTPAATSEEAPPPAAAPEAAGTDNARSWGGEARPRAAEPSSEDLAEGESAPEMDQAQQAFDPNAPVGQGAPGTGTTIEAPAETAAPADLDDTLGRDLLLRLGHRTADCGGAERVEVDVVVDGASGRVVAVHVDPTVTGAARDCLNETLRSIHFPRNPGVSRSRYRLSVPLAPDGPPPRVLTAP